MVKIVPLSRSMGLWTWGLGPSTGQSSWAHEEKSDVSEEHQKEITINASKGVFHGPFLTLSKAKFSVKQGHYMNSQ